AAAPDLLDRALERPAPRLQLLGVEAVGVPQLGERGLVEGPLVALEVDGGRERQARDRIQAERVEELEPDVDVAVGLHPAAAVAVQRVRHVGVGVDAAEGRDHAWSCVRTASGQPAGSKPCVRNSASAMRSSPKPMQPVFAVLPSAVRMAKTRPKRSWWMFTDTIAVGLSSLVMG